MAQQNTGGFGVAHPVQYSPKEEKPDLAPSDSQPAGVDDEPQSLEEALLGEPAEDPSVNPRRRVRYSG